MKLLYVYFKYNENDKLVFKNETELNFDSSCRFSLKGNLLNATLSPDVLPNSFFSVLPVNVDNPVVDDVSVVVGENGTGKTTLAEVLVDIKAETPQTPKFAKYIVVYRRWNDSRCYCETNLPDLVLPDNVSRVNRTEFPRTVSFASVPMVYMTPHFTPYPVVDINRCSTFSDLSILGAMEKDMERYFNSSVGKIMPRVLIGVYRTEQTKHMLSFYSGENKLPLSYRFPIGNGNNIPTCKPKGILISISKVAYQKRESKDIDSDVKKILCKIDDKSGEFVVNVFYSYAGLYLNDMPIKPFSVPDGGKEDIYVQDLKKAWDEFQAYQISLKDFCLQESQTDVESVLRFFKGAVENHPEEPEIRSIKAFFEELVEVDRLVQGQYCSHNNSHVRHIPANHRVIASECSSEFLQKVLNLVHLHFESQRILSFLDFDTFPRMSSGERAFYDTWGRLYHHYRESVDFSNQNRAVSFDITDRATWLEAKDAIVFLDEVETTMHPEWQRQLVKRTIWFFEAFVPWIHPHIIFATHSPILLSDVPSGNVIRLRRNQDGESEVVENDEASTFAANIFDLYKDSFFLDKGTMGAFASDKVDALLRKLSARRDENETEEEYQKRTKIGDEDLMVAKLIGDPFLSRYVWRRLEELNKDYDTPEDEQGGEGNGDRS